MSIERFEIGELLGSGTFGAVHRARDTKTGASVALKRLTYRAPDAILRFKNEFRALQDIDHPNLVHFGELFEHGGDFFFTMELVEGVSLLDWVRPGRRATRDVPTLDDRSSGSRDESARGPDGATFHEERLRDALRQIADALATLHAAGLVHCDIKPGNVRVTAEGRVVLLDFGLVARPSGSSGSPDAVVGTPAYMAPEQSLAGAVSPATDWYAVGVVLFELLTGSLPFTGPAIAQMVRKQLEPAPTPRALVEAIPVDLEALCNDLLEKESGDRPLAREVILRLEGGAAGARDSQAEVVEDVRTVAFVGREPELAVLERTLEAGREPRLTTCVVEGDSGVGKTALVGEALRRRRERGDSLLVLSGRCYEHENVPFKAFDGVVDSLARLLEALPNEQIWAALPRRAWLLVRMFPVLGRVRELLKAPRGKAPPDPQELREQTFDALFELLARLTSLGRVAIVIDDLQWSDLESLQLLDALVRRADRCPVAVIALVRTSAVPEEVARRVELLGSRDGEAHRLSLAPLGPSESAELARRWLEHEGIESVPPETIAAEGAGQPLFIAELARHARSASRRDGPVAVDILDALSRRVDALGSDAREVAELVAVAGRRLSDHVLAVATDLGPAELDRALKGLRVQNFVRTAALGAARAIEPFHDRVREAVLACLDPEALRRCHLRLAQALEEITNVDPEGLVFHFREAGELRRAARYAVAAAERARRALSWSTAARFFAAALELDPDRPEDERRRLHVGHADCLAHAGRCAEAADAYMSAVALAAGDEARALQQRAAQKYLQSGRLGPGRAVAAAILRAAGSSLPSSRWAAIPGIYWNRARAAMRGYEPRRRRAPASPAELRHVDLFHAVGQGLSMVDYIVGAAFHAKALVLALESADPVRVARALANEGAAKAAAEDYPARDGLALIERARAIAAELDDPFALAYADMCAAIAACTHMQFDAALEAGRRAERLFREHCSDCAWELGSTEWAIVTSLWNRGLYAVLDADGPRYLRAAGERGDLYSTVMLTCSGTYMADVARDAPGDARAAVTEAIDRWGRDDFQVQHFVELEAMTDIDVYDAANVGPAALERQDARWDAFKKSLLPTIKTLHFVQLECRARAALAAARGAPARTDELLRRAERDLRSARKIMSTPVHPGVCDQIEANIAAARGDTERAVALLVRADERLRAGGMDSFAAAARYRAGLLEAGDSGRARVDEADTFLRSRGVAAPRRYAYLRSPGLWE